MESGGLILVDPCYLKKWQPGEFRQEVPEALNHYDEACKLTIDEPWYGRMLEDNAVVVAPADGDGSYPVYGYFSEDGYLVKISVVLGVEAVEPFDMPMWGKKDEGYVLDPAEPAEVYIDES
ncbi:MAG: hypothetical protein ABI670_15245 [Chloroflexota bacterium]